MLVHEAAIYLNFQTLNHAYPTNKFGRRYLTDEGKFFKEAIKGTAPPEKKFSPDKLPERGFILQLGFLLPADEFFTKQGTWKRFDLSNLIKLTEDGIVEGFGIDDSKIGSIIAGKMPCKIPKPAVHYRLLLAVEPKSNPNEWVGVPIQEARLPCESCESGVLRGFDQFHKYSSVCPICEGTGTFAASKFVYNPFVGVRPLKNGRRCCKANVTKLILLKDADVEGVIGTVIQCRKCHTWEVL